MPSDEFSVKFDGLNSARQRLGSLGAVAPRTRHASDPQSSDSRFLAPSLAINWAMTFSSSAEKEAVSGAAESMRFSVCRTRSNTSLSEGRSALAERFTSCVTIALHLVILRRLPFWVTTTRSFSASLSKVERFLSPAVRPFGLPEWPFLKCRRCLHFGKCALHRELVPSRTSVEIPTVVDGIRVESQVRT
jgi:hypothetical protein